MSCVLAKEWASMTKSHIFYAHTIYLPHPDNQLVIKTDAASLVPGIGHTIYAIKNEELIPIRFHLSRLKD